MELYHTTLSLQEKLEILSDAAKYEKRALLAIPVPPASATVLPGTADVSPC